ncbi:hypothetical protein [Serratia bockelmannii]|uniref:hypothetical protein n=1 Tax=Serratia bockelmannii TaxID=2703793 RepID=UPI002360F6A2|nr:hypothetical protein [Serratia bockelmannii]
MATTKADFSKLKANFAAWQVPTDEDFAQLIDLAAVSVQPGSGLAGGDPSVIPGVADPEGASAFTVKAAFDKGLVVSDAGIALRVDEAGGLVCEQNKGLSVKTPVDASLSIDGGLHVQMTGVLKLDTGVSLQIDERQGLSVVKGALSVHSDSQTLRITDTGTLALTCSNAGGLLIDSEGCLAVDINMLAGYVVK